MGRKPQNIKQVQNTDIKEHLKDFFGENKKVIPEKINDAFEAMQEKATEKNQIVALDKKIKIYNIEPCNMYVGPCACGSWHHIGDIEQLFLRTLKHKDTQKE